MPTFLIFGYVNCKSYCKPGYKCMHWSKYLQHLLIKERDIINYTWVMGSEQPWGIVFSSREMLSIGGLKLSGYKQNTILPECVVVFSTFLWIFFSFQDQKDTWEGFLFSDPSFWLNGNHYWALDCQKVNHAWLACGEGSSTTLSKCAVLRASCTCPVLHLSSESPSLSLHCLLVAVLYDQIFIEVSSRAKSPHLNF